MRPAAADVLRAGSCAEMHPWRAGDVRAAARHSGRVRKFLSSIIAVLPPASGSDGASGSRPSAPATPIIARTRHGHSVHGRRAIANTGASTGARTHNTARAIATGPGSGSVIAGSVRLRRKPHGSQRWTRRWRIRRCLQALIGSSRRPPRSLQRWTRVSWKSLWSQRDTGERRTFAKRGRDRSGGAARLALPDGHAVAGSRPASPGSALCRRPPGGAARGGATRPFDRARRPDRPVHCGVRSPGRGP